MPAIKHSDYYYIHCAKTAGMAISWVLRKNYGGMRVSSGDLLDAVKKGKFIFASVRNPYDRVLSLWWSMCSPGDYYHVIADGMSEPVTFLKYIISGRFKETYRTKFATHLEKTCSEQIGGIKLDGIIHFESLLADFNALPFVKEPVTSLPIENRKSWGANKGRPERWPLDIPEFCQLIGEWCKEDFERFGYEIGKIPEEVN